MECSCTVGFSSRLQALRRGIGGRPCEVRWYEGQVVAFGVSGVVAGEPGDGTRLVDLASHNALDCTLLPYNALNTHNLRGVSIWRCDSGCEMV